MQKKLNLMIANSISNENCSLRIDTGKKKAAASGFVLS
jgi:hypothetical protein